MSYRDADSFRDKHVNGVEYEEYEVTQLPRNIGSCAFHLAVDVNRVVGRATASLNQVEGRNTRRCLTLSHCRRHRQHR